MLRHHRMRLSRLKRHRMRPQRLRPHRLRLSCSEAEVGGGGQGEIIYSSKSRKNQIHHVYWSSLFNLNSITKIWQAFFYHRQWRCRAPLILISMRICCRSYNIGLKSYLIVGYSWCECHLRGSMSSISQTKQSLLKLFRN